MRQILEPRQFAESLTEALLKKIDAASARALNFNPRSLICATPDGIFGELSFTIEGVTLNLRRAPGSKDHNLLCEGLSPQQSETVAKAIAQKFINEPEHRKFNTPTAERVAAQIAEIPQHPDLSRLTGWKYSSLQGTQDLERDISLDDGSKVVVKLQRSPGREIFEFVPFKYQLSVSRRDGILTGETLLRNDQESIVSAFNLAFGNYKDNLDKLAAPIQAAETAFIEQVTSKVRGEILLAGRMVGETLFAFVRPRGGEACVLVLEDGTTHPVAKVERGSRAFFFAETTYGIFQSGLEFPDGRWKPGTKVHRQNGVDMRVFFCKQDEKPSET